MKTERFRKAIRSIDLANSNDPNTIVVDGEARPKELTHAAMLTAWVEQLHDDPGEALLLAARAHHLRRWSIPREGYPQGRSGYLRWRRALQEQHAAGIAVVLRDVGYDPELIQRVQDLVRKKNLKRDPDVQTLEDGLCLVFLETQLSELREQYGDAKTIEILQKTWKKMSRQARDRALELDLHPDERSVVERAVANGSEAT